MFRIISFTIHKHPLLGGKTFELTNPKEDKTQNYYSVIIGPNGTGKSYLLNNLIEAFNEIAMLKAEQAFTRKKRFTLIYELNRAEFKVSTEKKEIVFEKNGKVSSILEIEIPNKWIASSVTINDKYPILNYIRKKQIPQYKYLGIRSATNNAFISRITINTVLYLIEALRRGKDDKLLFVYEALSLSPKLEIIFIGGPMLKLEKKEGKYGLYKTEQKIVEPHHTFIKKNKSKTNYRVDNYKKHIDKSEGILSVFEFMQSNHSTFEKPTKAGMQLKYIVDLKGQKGIDKLLKDWDVISIMLDLELLKIGKFLINKDSAFRYEEASSGESHLITSLHGIIANLEDNSLLVIDEPEVSLHPNWQIEYLDILKSIVHSYKGVNSVISSHSHLLVSSLKNKESRISSLIRDKESGTLKIEELDFETYGWEPERILYKIFGLVTQRNNYFENDLRSLIRLISDAKSDLMEVKRLYKILSYYVLSDKDDPLKVVISRAEQYINNRNA